MNTKPIFMLLNKRIKNKEWTMFNECVLKMKHEHKFETKSTERKKQE